MKKHLKLLLASLAIFAFVSCSSNDDDQNFDLLGVWESTVSDTNSVSTFNLVFGESNTGLTINSVVNGELEISSINTFRWELKGITVTLEDIDTDDKVYTLNTEGQLVLMTSDNQTVILDKVSDDYAKYY
ncbi:hypothetical protein ACFFU1_17245 [Algibacter miyuki]|uniref:Lipocalin-like domain-containing protein n=1 Tax=Algibacter miyuki TaxID=1306933 RepID=A0ABV5H469_9FLAO|nr:hypothetical protein [Algibacter miyuki]MDN3665725.1 hypothetical protein [Algibacter miyuki]